ncbi:uncharacterized protein LOC143274705 [Babylonia areolata]|uniref:uncharacterized protein LOC143274705 n=1 Tax=Babylonia areolata TaxID=304850 RepID=UPI003FD161E3
MPVKVVQSMLVKVGQTKKVEVRQSTLKEAPRITQAEVPLMTEVKEMAEDVEMTEVKGRAEVKGKAEVKEMVEVKATGVGGVADDAWRGGCDRGRGESGKDRHGKKEEVWGRCERSEEHVVGTWSPHRLTVNI